MNNLEAQLQKEHDKSQVIIEKQQAAITLLLDDLEEKEGEVEELSKKRMDIQMETRAKQDYLMQLQQRVDRMKQETKDRDDRRLGNRLARGNTYEIIKVTNEDIQEIDIEEKYDALEKEAKELIEMKTSIIQKQCEENLKTEISKKLRAIQEKPLDILKRLESYQSKGSSGNDGQLAQGKPYTNTVLIKVFVDSISKDQVDSEQEDYGDEEFDMKSMKSHISKKSNMSKATSFRTRKTQQQVKIEKEKKFERDNEKSSDPQFLFFMETFKISKMTFIKDFQQIVCDYWGLKKDDMDFYDDSGEKIESEGPGVAGSKRTVEKVLEQILTKELKDKDLHPPGPRKSMLYLGNKHFEVGYKRLMELKRMELEEEKKQKKDQRNIQDQNYTDGPEVEERDILPTKEEIFLRQFPGLSGHYATNKELFRKGRKKEGFLIEYGDWIPPTCCSMLVNIVQWLLTYWSIMLYKGDNSAFWLPELVRGDLELEFKKIQDVNHFWKFAEETVGEYVFEHENLLVKSGIIGMQDEVDVKRLNLYDPKTLARHSKGRLFIGPMRFLQKRVLPKDQQHHSCLRNSTVKRYQKYFEKCYPLRFVGGDDGNEDKAEKVEIMRDGQTTSFKKEKGYQWGQYVKQQQQHFRFTKGSEFYHGHLGDYFPEDGYKQDFYPYDQTLDDYRKILEKMKDDSYIKIGSTKMVDIDFTLSYPSTAYFVSVNMVIEFTSMGQVIPTRIDILPYKLSGFSDFGNTTSHTIDILKILLVVYTLYAVLTNFQSYGTIENIFRLKNIWANIVDIMIIILQTYSFAIKVQDGQDFDFEPSLILTYEKRHNYQSIYFMARNFRDFCICETIGLIFVLLKVVDGFRYIQRLNNIVMCVQNSAANIFIFMVIMVLFNLVMTPLAQAIWGNQLIGYKTFTDALASVFLIAYSKGNLEKILDINLFWAFIFTLIYYFIILFILHSAMHYIQTDSLRNIVLLNSLKENDIIPEEVDPDQEMDKAKFLEQKKKDNIAKIIKALQWFFGWLPRENVKKIETLNDIVGIQVERAVNSDDSDDVEMVRGSFKKK